MQGIRECIICLVNIVMQKCTYGEWKVTELPCAHVVACLVRMYGHNTLWECNVSRYHHVECNRNTYSYDIEAIRNVTTWPNVEGMVTIRTPTYSRGLGCPRTTRMHSNQEPPITTRVIARCLNCGVTGHNCSSCKQPRYSNVLFVVILKYFGVNVLPLFLRTIRSKKVKGKGEQ